MNRLETTFDTLRANGKKALITFTMAGDPDVQTSLAILETLAQSADVLEIGMPFSDPMADGPAIQAASLRALGEGTSMATVLEIVQKFRSKNKTTPVVLMGYFNPVFTYGIDKFMKDSAASGVDGLIIVDIPPEESNEILPQAQQNNLCLIRLLTPTTDEKRLPKILDGAGGFLYYVSIAGVTGTASADPAKVGAHIAQIKTRTALPVIAGFGIRTPADAAAMSKIADGVVVGSAFVQQIENGANAQEIGKQAAALKQAI